MTTVETDRADAVRAEVRAWLAENWDPQLTVRAWWAMLAAAKRLRQMESD